MFGHHFAKFILIALLALALAGGIFYYKQSRIGTGAAIEEGIL